MKKKSIKNLSLGKKTVSRLNKNEVTGGAPETFWTCPTPPISIQCPISFYICPTPPVSKYCTI